MRRSGKVFFAVGFLLILCSFSLLAFSHFRTQRAQKNVAEIVQTLESILPARTEGVMDSFQDMDMPALELDGEDFVAVVDIPAFGVTLPVCARWDEGKVTSYPCRFWGTVYDGSLIVGGYDQPGQFDFFDRIPDGAVVTVTDMTGGEFTYAVERVERSRSAQAEVLMDDTADLTLFVRDAYLLEYIILRCAAK